MNPSYWLRSIGRLAGNLAQDPFRGNGHRFEFSRQWLSAGVLYDVRPKLPSIHFLDLYPTVETLQVPLGNVTFTRSNATPYEIFCLSAMAMLHQPSRIFEFGTFDGATTLQLAKVCPAAELLTLDLAPDQASDAQPAAIGGEMENVRAGGVGHRFVGTPEAQRIQQLFGDSTKFDYAPFAGSVDLAFIDACHDYAFAASDTRAALQILKPGGTIVWHDYVSGWPGVIRAVDELLPKYPVKHIAGTALAVLETAQK